MFVICIIVFELLKNIEYFKSYSYLKYKINIYIFIINYENDIYSYPIYSHAKQFDSFLIQKKKIC